MNHFTLQVPTAQLVLDNHAQARKQQEIANHAVLEAVRAYQEFHEAAPEVVFGCDTGTVGYLASATKTEIAPTLCSGMPIFDIRIASEAFVGSINGPSRSDEAFRVLVESFAKGAPIVSLGDGSSMPSSASQAILDVHPHVRKKIEAANAAILDAVRTYVELGDPLAPFVFGVGDRVLQGLATTSRSKMLAILMTSIPIFSLRNTTSMLDADDAEEADDLPLVQMLKSFSSVVTA